MRRFISKLPHSNVLTMQAGSRHEEQRPAGVTGPARQEWILATLDEHAVTLFAWQETRTKVVRRFSDPRYVLVQSAATPQGQFGIMIGLSKQHAHGQHGDESVVFNEEDFKIVHCSASFADHCSEIEGSSNVL